MKASVISAAAKSEIKSQKERNENLAKALEEKSAPTDDVFRRLHPHMKKLDIFKDHPGIKSSAGVPVKPGMKFRNLTDGPLEMLWITHEGKATSYGWIDTGLDREMDTYVTHPWIFRNSDKVALFYFIPKNATGCVVPLCRPPMKKYVPCQKILTAAHGKWYKKLEVEYRGVQLQVLENIKRQHPKVVKYVGQKFVDLIIKPSTSDLKCSYSELIYGSKAAINESKEENETYTGRCQIFISHAWFYKFGDLVTAIKGWEKRNPKFKGTYYFLDYLVINQHKVLEDLTQLDNLIKTCKATLLVLSPWRNPIPLTRSWCLFEIMHTISNGKALEICLPRDEEMSFYGGVLQEYKSIQTAIRQIDARKAKAKYEADAKMIADQIEETCGFDKMNAMVKDHMNDWFKEQLKTMVDPEKVTNLMQLYINLSTIAVVFKHLNEYGIAVEYSQRAFDLYCQPEPGRRLDDSSRYYAWRAWQNAIEEKAQYESADTDYEVHIPWPAVENKLAGRVYNLYRSVGPNRLLKANKGDKITITRVDNRYWITAKNERTGESGLMCRFFMTKYFKNREMNE